MKRLITLLVFTIFTIGIYAQSGISTFKYETRFLKGIRIGGATTVKLDSIIQSVDTIKFYNGGTELFSKGAGTWTGTGIGLDTTWAKLSLKLDQVTNESKASLFNAPVFTSFTTIHTGLIPAVAGTAYIGSSTHPFANVYLGATSYLGWGNAVFLQGGTGLLSLTGGNLSLGTNSLLMTGSIGLTGSRITKGWFTDLEITNTITGTASAVTGYTPAGSSLTLNGADAVTFRTTAATDVTFPTSGTLLNSASLSGYAPLDAPTFTGDMAVTYIRPVTSTGVVLGNPTYPWANMYLSATGGVIWNNSVLLALTGGELRLENSPLLINNNDIGKMIQPVRHGYFNEVTIVDTMHIANISNVPTISTTDTLSTQAYARDRIADSLANFVATASLGLAAADTNTYGNAVTLTYVESLLGSGSGLTAQTLPFIIGVTTGAPAAGDSTVVHTAFDGKHIDVYRSLSAITGGAKQYQNFTATNIYDGFRVNHDTVTVNPVWVTGEQVMIDIIEPILWSYLSLEGEESALLDSLNGYWKFDESSGTAVVDATGTQNGTTNATAGVAGKLGLARDFDAANDVVNIAYNADIVPSGADFSVAMWFKMDSLPSVMAQNNYLFQQNVGISPWSAHYIYVASGDDKITVSSRNTDGTGFAVRSSGTISVDTWYHIVFVNRGNGQTLQLYLNGTDVSASAGTFTGTLIVAAAQTCFGNSYSGSTSYFDGIIDEAGIWNRALTSGEVTTLYNSGNGKTHPFN